MKPLEPAVLQGARVAAGGDLRPTDEGMGIAKDVWMTAMGVAMLIDEASEYRSGRR